MALPSENVSMALYCDFENVALGVRDAKYNKFDIKPVLERLLLKGSIVVKKAYCDWDRYKEFKSQMHEASFELIEIPHVRMSGKNSADIRLVVDALDLCYTKSHVNTFVIISGDSDFSPLVSKLRENAKYVIGVGVKDSTSDLLVANCDEFIFIDDLVRESRRTAAKRAVKQASPAARPVMEDESTRKEDLEARKAAAIDIAIETFDALFVERGENGKIWASTLKQAIKRRKPDFNETYFGFKTFGNLLEEAQARGLIEIGRDDRSGAYVSRSNTVKPGTESRSISPGEKEPQPQKPVVQAAMAPEADAPQEPSGAPALTVSEPHEQETAAKTTPAKSATRQNRRTGRKPVAAAEKVADAQADNAGAIESADAALLNSETTASKTRRKPAARTGRRRKPAEEKSGE
ncbi:NYN domain-containing protein [Oxalobacteraceae bacterium R-40]|uniref:NYN domain-containing protein n=1 Tax=Keguizhuia sedimenti TaxID=3064264 RepID=A0ABU1BM78_9BURK|nr:NYN domain-containing protein [Oxalobacteraceae bacterium R-40]